MCIKLIEQRILRKERTKWAVKTDDESVDMVTAKQLAKNMILQEKLV